MNNLKQRSFYMCLGIEFVACHGRLPFRRRDEIWDMEGGRNSFFKFIEILIVFLFGDCYFVRWSTNFRGNFFVPKFFGIFIIFVNQLWDEFTRRKRNLLIYVRFLNFAWIYYNFDSLRNLILVTTSCSIIRVNFVRIRIIIYPIIKIIM